MFQFLSHVLLRELLVRTRLYCVRAFHMHAECVEKTLKILFFSPPLSLSPFESMFLYTIL